MSDNEEQKLWVLKTVEDADRTLQTVDHYDDDLNSRYNYDDKVQNHKQIKEGDNIIFVDKENVLGFAQIDSIEINEGFKTIRKCPFEDCNSTTIDTRKKLLPKYRCSNGHIFEQPVENTVRVKKYIAHYPNSFRPIQASYSGLEKLRPYYVNGYNQNMSMQLLAMEALNNYSEASYLFTPASTLKAIQAFTKQEAESLYNASGKDERSIIFRQIRERRGQQKFRNALFKRYGPGCMVTGSGLTDILEAAHINPYRGASDNHVANGLLLRSDIHTLFDLNLLGIEPKSLTIHIANRAMLDYGGYNGLLLHCKSGKLPSSEALHVRWKLFQQQHR